MSMVPSSSGKAGSWRVTGQTPTTRPGPNGRFVDGMLVHFATGLGNVGTVFVPEANYNQATVGRAVAAKAALIDSVAQLSSDQ